MSADIAAVEIGRLQTENRRLVAQIAAAEQRAALSMSCLAQAQMELVELRHHLSPKPEVRHESSV